ncbi:Uncharacterized protein GY17_00000659 [Cryptosporidium hominis]|uniref:Uncharacterized protein n=2 Tax=Cryptosporidium hominis TaxID=237895 RepID=A0ABX5BIX0_CRYHO|nr:Uncharacterized protein GY17_00000659 [Cryptosporidium hominis]|eukprot:PPS98114.1 Uncharacterized protein GY17_00000659 [Cryptosporidium hominis]
MQFNYDDLYNKKIDGFVEFESELAKLRKETSLLYKNEYVKDFLENYHLEINEAKENSKGRWNNKGENLQTRRNFKSTKNDINVGTYQPYSYEVEYKTEHESDDYSTRKNVKSLKERKKEKTGKKKGKKNLVDGGMINNNNNNNNNGFAVFSRKYGTEDVINGKGYLTMDLSEIKGDIVKSPKKKTSQIHGESKTNKKKGNLSSASKNLKKNDLKDSKKQTILYHNKKLSNPDSKLEVISQSYSIFSSSSSSSSEESENEYRDQIKKYKKRHYSKGDEKIKYYLDQSSSLEDDNEGGDEDEGIQKEFEDQTNGLAVSNSFLSRLPNNSQAQALLASQQYEQNERDLLMKRIQSLEVIESSQKMLILETQNKEQQYRIRSEELQKQVEYKDTKLLLLNQDYEILKKDFALLKDEKEMLKNKYTEMEAHWNQEYGNLYKYKVDYEILSKQNETLMIEKNSFINLIEEDKERYRKMELNNTSLMLNVDNLEKRNHEIVERCSKLQEDHDSLSREYNKLYQKYTALLSEYTASKKNEENLNASLVELQDINKKLDIEGRDMKEKYKTLSATERVLEQLQESNAELIGEISALKEERDILSADYKILEKKYKTSEESMHEIKNQLLDFTLENQKFKKLIKQTIIPLIPNAEYNSTIGHILMVMNAKENSRMSTKVLEEEYLNNINNNGKGKNKDELQLEVSKVWKGIESPFSPKKISYMMNGLSIDHQSSTMSRLLSPKSVSKTTNLEKKSLNSPSNSSSPKSLKNKFNNMNKNGQSPKSVKYNSNLNKFEKLSPKGHQLNKDELTTKSMPILDGGGHINEKVVVPKLFNSTPDLYHADKNENGKTLNQNQEEKNHDSFKKGVQIVTPRPLVIDDDDHSIPVILPKRLEGKIKDVLENEDKIIPVIPKNISSFNDKEQYNDDIILDNVDIEDESEFALDIGKKEENNEFVDKINKNLPSVNDTIRMIDNLEKQILLLNVEKVQLEAELSTLPKDNWSKNEKEKKNKDNIERRILEIENSIIKASSNIKHLKDNKHKKNDNTNNGHKDHHHHHRHHQQQQKQKQKHDNNINN